MALFKKKQKPQQAPAKPETYVIWHKTYKQSGSFRGFRRVKLAIYNEPGVDDTLAYFKPSGYNFKDRSIQLQCIRSTGVYVNEDMLAVNVFVEGMRIGCVYGTSSYYDMMTEKIDKVHLKVDNNDVLLFVHYTDN